MKAFNWANIDRGFQGFEDLAFTYVESEYEIKDGWTHTPYTKDGNRDGYSIICGFRPHDLSPEEWWMEAKYSTDKKRLSRYRLDSTIVSAAIHGNVSKVVFVTNISVSTKTIVDIRAALKQAIHCREVHFCVKSTLEYWLTQHPDIFQKFFPDTNINSLSIKSLFLSEEIEFFSDQKFGLSVFEPLKYLQLGREYYLYFSVYSNRAQTLPLSVSDGFSDVILLSPASIAISPGITPCAVKISLKSNYSMIYNLPDGRTVQKSDRLDGALMKLGPLELIVKTPMEVMAAAYMLYLPSQEQNLERLKETYDIAQSRMQPSINFLTGVSGSGKTYLMERFVREKIDLEQSVFRVTFSTHRITNDLNIYYFLAFCLYPYLPPDMVDESYLKKLQDSGIECSVIYRAARYLQQPDLLHQFFISAMSEDIFPVNLNLNPRIILLDDLHKLEPDSLNFLLAAIAELAEKRQPIFVLANGWPEIMEASTYRTTKKRTFVQEFFCSLTKKDLAAAITRADILNFDFDPQLCTVIFPNVIELLAFIKYLKGRTLHNFEDFLIESRLFLGSSIAKECILEPFQKLFAIDSASAELCTRVYWSVNGIPFHDPMTETESKLIQYELIKINDKNTRLIPYHDLYRQIFCQKFELPANVSETGVDDVYVDTARILTAGGTKAQLTEALALLQQWKHEGRFYAILYVLEGLFETFKKDSLRSKLGDVAYFQLYLCYAFGITNGSRSKSGKSVFQEIVEQTASESDPEILIVRMDAIFELINSSYEWLMHDTARIYIKMIDNLIGSLQKIRKLPQDPCQCEKYILTRQIEMLISSEQEEEQAETLFQNLEQIANTYHYDYERTFFKLRYAESLYFRNTSRALDMVNECKNCLLTLRGPEEKFYLWAKMDYAFLQFILKKPDADLKDMKAAHDALKKDCFNDYRKRLFALASVYYASGLVQSGDQILFSDATTLRELRPRQKAFYAETMAIHYALSGDIIQAENELQKAAELFHKFPSYLTVIRHNQDILKSGAFRPDKIDFCTDKFCRSDWYCIDPRCIW